MRKGGLGVSVLASSLVLASCFHTTRTPNAAQPSQVPSVGQPSLSTPVQSAPTPTPSPAPATPPVITPTPGPSTQAAPAPNLTQQVPRLKPDAAPQILAIAVSETAVQPGDRVSGRVVTSSNVASVEARIGGYAMTLSKVGVGRFEITYTVRPLPWFIRGTFTMQVIARNTRGDAVERAIPLHVR